MNKINLETFGKYDAGLTTAEIQLYLKLRTGVKDIKQLYNRFCKIAGANTGMISPAGEFLMYRHDVQRYADKLLFGKETYFD